MEKNCKMSIICKLTPLDISALVSSFSPNKNKLRSGRENNIKNNAVS